MLLGVRIEAPGRTFSQEKSHEGREATYDEGFETPAKPVFALTRRWLMGDLPFSRLTFPRDGPT
jgi:hypothetical protein